MRRGTRCSEQAGAGAAHQCGEGPEWGMRAVGNIPQLGELIPSWNGDGVFTGREPHNTKTPMKKRFLIPAICAGGFLGLAALGFAINKTELALCNGGNLDACSEVVEGTQDQITNPQWLADKAEADKAEADKKAKRDALLAKAKADRDAQLARMKAERAAADAKFAAEGWFQVSPGIYGRWCTQTCSDAEVIGDAAYWLMEVWAKDRAAGDIYAQINVLKNGTVIGWTNDTAYLSRGQKGVLTFTKYLPGSGSQYKAQLVKFDTRY